jgi:hypothetical protein
LEAALSEQEAAEAFRNANSRAARVIGRISLYVETVRCVNDESLQNAVKDAQAEVIRLESQISDDADQDISVLDSQSHRNSNDGMGRAAAA